jgi:hypothetical protein
VCRLHNTPPNGCPYGKDCILLHRCTSGGAMDGSACPCRPDGPADDNPEAPPQRR